MAQEPQRVPKAAQADDFGVLSVPEEMGAAMFGPVALYGDLEVPPGGLELTLPERGDPKHIRALHEEHIVAITLPARPEAFPKPLRQLEVALGEAGERQRTQQRWLRLDCKRTREIERALLHLCHAARPVSLDRAQRRGERRKDRQLAHLALA